MATKSDIQKLKGLFESSDLLDAMGHFMIKKIRYRIFRNK
jgi:hypothetical protein